MTSTEAEEFFGITSNAEELTLRKPEPAEPEENPSEDSLDNLPLPVKDYDYIDD